MLNKGLLVLCISAVILTSATAANAAIIVTSAGTSYDLTALGATDYWVVGSALEGAGSQLSLSNAYTSSRPWWSGDSYSQTVNNMATVYKWDSAQAAGPGPTITVNGTSTTGYHLGGADYGVGFTVGAGDPGRTLHFIMAIIQSDPVTGSFQVTGNTTVTQGLGNTWNAQYWEVTADVPASGATVYVGQNTPNGAHVAGFSAAWLIAAPEPTTMGLLAIGAIGMLRRRRRSA